MTKQYEALIEAKEHGNNKLPNDKMRLSEKRETIRTDATRYRTGKAEAFAALEQCEKKFVRDEITADDLAAAQARFNEISEKLAATERLEHLVTSELQNTEREIIEAVRNIQACHRDFCLSEKAVITTALDHDPKIRAKLLEAYAAMVSNPYGYNFDWKLFISSIFSQPTQDEVNEAIDKFKQKHILNQ